MPWGEAKMHSFSYTNDQVLYNQLSPYFLCRVSWLLIITNSGSLNLIRLNEYQLKSISFNYNICGIWKIFNHTRQRKYGLIHINRIGGVMVIVLDRIKPKTIKLACVASSLNTNGATCLRADFCFSELALCKPN